MLNTQFRSLHTKQKGEIAEANIIALLLEFGYSIAKPFGDNQSYDLVLDRDDKLSRVQCKLARLEKDKIIFQASKCRINKHEFVVSNYIDKIEFFAVWLPELRDNLYLVPIDKAGKRDTELSLLSNSKHRLKAIDYQINNTCPSSSG